MMRRVLMILFAVLVVIFCSGAAADDLEFNGPAINFAGWETYLLIVNPTPDPVVIGCPNPQCGRFEVIRPYESTRRRLELEAGIHTEFLDERLDVQVELVHPYGLPTRIGDLDPLTPCEADSETHVTAMQFQSLDGYASLYLNSPAGSAVTVEWWANDVLHGFLETSLAPGGSYLFKAGSWANRMVVTLGWKYFRGSPQPAVGDVYAFSLNTYHVPGHMVVVDGTPLALCVASD